MGFIQKKDEEKDVIDGVEIIGRGEGPDGVDENPVVLVPGESAEDIAAGTTAADAAVAAEAQSLADATDEALMEGIADQDSEDDAKSDGSKPAPRPRRRPADPKGPAGPDKPGSGLLAAGGNRRLLFGALGIAIILAVAICGYFLGRGGFAAHGTGSATVAEDKLDAVVATWSYNGHEEQLTAREAIEDQVALDSVKDADGNYAVPSAETILGYVRNRILLAEASSRNLEATDEEAAKYAEDSIGTSDYATIAARYNVSEEQAKRIVKDNTVLSKLYQEVAGDTSSVEMPEAPAEPEGGDTSAASKDYADYIIKLAGDEWDASKGTWASEDGPFHAALKDEQFSADSATYAQAQTAYYVAYQRYAEQSQASQSKWTEFVNGLYAKASVNLYGLYM
ncbi:MAG: hypothetical protein E7001_07160 [Coriobacteriaceae bacterium]|nr:hypothetical protein [Coriobacteriaceae bacterium]